MITLALLLWGCDRPVDTDDTEPYVPAGPVLEHTLPEGELLDGDAVTLEVSATDPDGVAEITAYWRPTGDPLWEPVSLVAGDDDLWSGEITAVAPSVEYWFRAVDGSDLALSSSTPAGGQDDPYVLPVQVVGVGLPVAWDFEGDDLYGLGWTELSEGFEGYAWAVRSDRAASGQQAATHRRGVEDLPVLTDWLISPPVDLSTLPAAQVTWQEQGDYADLADHRLLLSTEGPTLESTWEEVALLGPPPEDAWARSAAYDLSPWAGERTVWLAWVYEGQYADSWYIDDVSVGPLGPDLHLIELAWTPVDPGGTSTLTLSLENHTEVDAVDLQVSVTPDPGTAGTASVGTLAGLGDAEVAVDVGVEPDHPDNSWLPLTVTAWTADQTWEWSERLVVGDPSAAWVELTTAELGLVQASIGRGDPSAPDLLVPVAADILDAGTWTWDVDLTDRVAYLPPGPGADRWWLQVETSSASTVDAFSIATDGVEYASDDVGPVAAASPTLVNLPRPPSPEVYGTTSTPDPVAPGDAVAWELTLVNRGLSTVGETTLTLSTAEPHVSGLTAGPLTLAADGWYEGALVMVPVSLDVDAAHTDSLPLVVDLVVTDAAESFDLTASLEVPWPVLGVTSLAIDDWADGDDDGLLDPAEHASLELSLTNGGGLDTFGAVSCTLSQTGGTATATFVEDTGAFGLIGSGETKEEDDFELSVAGAVGDTAELLVACADASTTYDIPLVLTLGERPWQALSAIDDPRGDAIGGYPFDVVNGSYRCDGTTLEITLRSATPIDPSTLFMEMWASSTGAPYTWYQVAFQSGVGKLRGYRSGSFTLLSNPTITALDTHTVQLLLDVPSMDLVLDNLSMGFATGFCGGDAYYCDHFPDDWGNPYQSGMSTSRWVDLTW